MRSKAIVVVNLAVQLCLFISLAHAGVPQITQLQNEEVQQGSSYGKLPTLAAPEKNVRWSKEYGPDDLSVDPESGKVSWSVPSGLAAESFHVGVRASTPEGSSCATWIVKVGGGRFIYVGVGEKHKTISDGSAAARAGDTIVVRDGNYSGDSNTISNLHGGRGNLPPSGAPGMFTTVMAEHPGQAVMDGKGRGAVIYLNGSYRDRSNNPFSPCPACYLAIKGFVAGNAGEGLGPIQTNHADHIKIVDCGAYDAGNGGTPISINRSGYVLVEGCYVWGNGRMRIVFYICDHCIMRRNVARHDRSNEANPIGLYDVYSCQHTRVQNVIAIDSDQYRYYLNYTFAAGAFIDQSGSSNGESWSAHLDNIFYNCIALNIHNKFTLSQNRDLSSPVKFYNSIGWDISAIPEHYGDTVAAPIILSPDNMDIDQCTFGRWRSPHVPLTHSSGTGTPVTVSGWASTQNITNSIFFDIRDYNNEQAGLFDAIENASHNNVYRTGAVNIKLSSVTGTIASDPTASCLKYLPRIESGCTLQNAGNTRERVGANIMYMRGKSGTLWGEEGYDSEGVVPMWPFPHEELIKAKMAAYSYDGGRLSGARGFCAGSSRDGSAQSLTRYIWEYLGNTIPNQVYGSR